MGHCLHDKAPGVEVFGPPALKALLLGREQPRLDRSGDALGDLVLEGEEVGEFDIVALRPDLEPGRRVAQLRADPKPLAREPYAAIEHVAHAQIAPYLPDIDEPAL